MSDLKRTPLYDLHLALNAKMVSFAGYHMPIQYPAGIIKEHLHCRSLAGLFDISHMGQCLVSGDNIVAQLDKLVPSDLITLSTGEQRYTVLTNPAGGIIDDLIIGRIDDSFMLVFNAACKEKVLTYLQRNLQCHFQILSEYALLALQGPSAKEVMAELSVQACDLSFMQVLQTDINGMQCMISRSGYTGEDGFEISIAKQYAQLLAELILSFAQVQPIGLGARDTLRLEAGLSLYGHELNEAVSPVEAGLSWLIDKNKTGFPGADVIGQQLQQGAARKRVGLLVEGKIPVRDHGQVYTGNDVLVGTITSGSFSPSLNQPIALALIDTPCLDKTLYAQIRDKKIALQVTQLPFVAHQYYRG
ncbi:MAG: glycine cleavage system aminomethyltransferase GcvT [Methyloprofundus sp.]|nr:glycine cleavage system aminomethyltransferase GcvT [Methyloprofundus sp.]MDT8426963.1 glycine cleavage system aminomethyltransferase GcvT [Methyloprofundus sp.]